MPSLPVPPWAVEAAVVLVATIHVAYALLQRASGAPCPELSSSSQSLAQSHWLIYTARLA